MSLPNSTATDAHFIFIAIEPVHFRALWMTQVCSMTWLDDNYNRHSAMEAYWCHGVQKIGIS